MNGFDFLRPRIDRRISALAAAGVPRHLQRPLAATAATLLFTAAAGAFEQVRITAASDDVARAHTRLAILDRDVTALRVLRTDVAGLRERAARLTAVRASGGRRADEIARIGNMLPPETSITTLRLDRDAVAVDGRARGLAAVSDAIGALAALPSFSATRLLAVHEDPAQRDVTYALALDRRP